MIIRNAHINDSLAIFELGNRYFDVKKIPYHIWSIFEVVTHLEQSEYCFVAEDNEGELIGFSLGASSFKGDDSTCHIEWIAVSEPYLHTGIGVKLFRRTCKALMNKCIGNVITDLCQANITANKIIAHAGFKKLCGINYFIKKLY